MRGIKLLGGVALLAVLFSIYLIFAWVPTERMMGIVQRIFYWHVPVNIVSFLAFGITAVGGALYLWKRERRWDILAHSSAEIGVVFCSLGLITGSIWAKPIWGTWWTWDPRLTTTLVLWLIYVAYLMLRNSLDDPDRRARFAAVFGIAGFADVPIVFMAIRWWRTIHPVLFEPGRIGLAPSMLVTFIVGMVAMILVFFYLLALRVGLENLRSQVASLKAQRAWDQGWKNST